MPKKITFLLSESLTEDKVAFLYYKYVNILFHWGKSFTSNNELIKDCIQDLFVQFLNKPDTLKNIQNENVYLFVSFQNNLFKAIKKESIFNKQEEFNLQTYDYFDPYFSIEDKIIKTEQKKDIKNTLKNTVNKLPVRQKRAIYLRFHLQMDYNEICSILEIDYQSARTIIYRAIKKLRKEACSKLVSK